MEGEKPAMVLIREIQKDPLSGKLIHVDFLTVSMDEKVNNLVSIQIIGEEDVLKKGAILQYGLKEAEILCLPKDIPDHFSFDVSSLEIGDKITMADIALPEGVELVTDQDANRCGYCFRRGEADHAAGETEEAGESAEA
jgi:large subunit ribosomal protein L25